MMRKNKEQLYTQETEASISWKFNNNWNLFTVFMDVVVIDVVVAVVVVVVVVVIVI